MHFEKCHVIYHSRHTTLDSDVFKNVYSAILFVSKHAEKAVFGKRRAALGAQPFAVEHAHDLGRCLPLRIELEYQLNGRRSVGVDDVLLVGPDLVPQRTAAAHCLAFFRADPHTAQDVLRQLQRIVLSEALQNAL